MGAAHGGSYNLAMGVVDDVHKLLQDLVTPEMREIAVKVEALDKGVETLRNDINEKFDNLRSEESTIRLS